MGHALMENRSGLIVAATLTKATGTAERQAAEEMIVCHSPGARRITLGADKGYDAAAFVADMRALNVTPHIAQNVRRPRRRLPCDAGGRRRVPPRPQNGAGGDRVKEVEIALSIGALVGLAEVQEPGRSYGEAGGGRGLGTMKLANAPGAQFEILVDGKPRSYRDIKAVAIASAEFLKSRNPHSEVAVKDLESGEVTVVTRAWDR